MVVKARSLVQKEINEQLWASVFRSVSRQLDTSLETTSENNRNKLEKLSERQEQSLGGRKRAIS